MCLCKAKPIKVATKDIVCWKVVEPVNRHDSTRYKAIYRSFIYELGVNYKLHTKLQRIDASIYSDGPEVKEGFHSYCTLKDLKSCNAFELRYNNYVIARCIIPKGSEYATGLGFGYPNYVSDAIIIQRIVN